MAGWLDGFRGPGPSTHVASKYPHPVWAKVEEEKVYVTEFNEDIHAGVNIAGKGGIDAGRKRISKYQWDKIKVGFTRILPKKFVRFDVGKGKLYVYLTVVVEEGDEEIIICEAVQKRADYSVIISEDGQVVDSVYGKIWEEIQH